jgi:NitT/TauT family transport system permease protein
VTQALVLKPAVSGPWLRVASLVLFVLVWEVAAELAQSRALPTPWQVTASMANHLAAGTLLADLAITLFRVAVAFVFAMLIGVAVGMLMGLRERVNLFLDGWLILFLNLPALVVIILCYVWFGLTEAAAILAVALNKIPNVIVITREGTRAIERELLQVAQVFHVTRARRFFVFFLPQLYPYMMAAARTGIALIWKIVLVVELLGRSDGIGFQLSVFFQLFDIAGILAYTLAFVAVMLTIELALLAPLERHLTRWRK